MVAFGNVEGASSPKGYDTKHAKVVDAPRRFRHESKQASQQRSKSFKFTDPAQEYSGGQNARFANRKSDRGDVIVPKEPEKADMPRARVRCLCPPPTSLVDDRKIGGHPDAVSPRRSGDCFVKGGKAKTAVTNRATSSKLDIHNPERMEHDTGKVGGSILPATSNGWNSSAKFASKRRAPEGAGAAVTQIRAGHPPDEAASKKVPPGKRGAPGEKAGEGVYIGWRKTTHGLLSWPGDTGASA